MNCFMRHEGIVPTMGFCVALPRVGVLGEIPTLAMNARAGVSRRQLRRLASTLQKYRFLQQSVPDKVLTHLTYMLLQLVHTFLSTDKLLINVIDHLNY